MIVSFSLNAQQKKSDPKGSPSNVRSYDEVGTWLNSAEREAGKDPNRALDLVEKALSKSIESKDKHSEAMAYQTLGLINYKQSIYIQAIENYKKALKLFEDLNDREQLFNTQKSLGYAYEANNNYEYASNSFVKLLKDPLIKEDFRVELNTKLGDISLKQGNQELAQKHYSDALKIEESRGNEKGILEITNKLGAIYLKQEKTSQALEYFEKSKNIAKRRNDKKELAESYENLGNVYRKEKKYTEELKVRQQSIELNKKADDTDALSEDYLAVGQSLVEQKNSAQAIPYLEKTISISDKSGRLIVQKQAYKSLSEAYRQKGEFEKAMVQYKKYVAAVDSLYQQKEREIQRLLAFNQQLTQKQKQIEFLEKKKELDEKTIELLQKDKNLKETIIYGLLFLLIIVFAASYLLFQSAKKRRIANQLLALRSLRSQMNPHFIFNALNSVNSFISKNDERSANKYLSDFSRLMRSVMENSQFDFVPLSSELKILELYLSLEHFRFSEKFSYQLKVDESINPEAIEIPPMLVQPYIENAIWHGLRYKDERGFLLVSIEKAGKDLLLRIEDDGIGRRKSQELKTENQKDKISLGMKNTESRLHIINELHKTNMRVSIEDANIQNQTGTKVEIRITPKLIQ